MRHLCFLLGLSAVMAWAADDPYAAEIYKKNCAQCHDQGGEARMPARGALEKMSAAAIVRTLETGVMREVGATLTIAERFAVARLLGKTAAAPATQTIGH